MNILCQAFAQHRTMTSGATHFAVVAAVVFMTVTQAPPVSGADTPPAGVAATPKVIQPATNSTAAPPMPSALEKLISDFRKARTACSADTFPAGFVSHVTKRGETAKNIIRQYWADLPLKEDFLKSVIDRLNPEAPVKNLSSPFKTGTLLAIPSSAVLNAAIFGSPEAKSAATEDEREPAFNSDGNFAAGWVQFP